MSRYYYGYCEPGESDSGPGQQQTLAPAQSQHIGGYKARTGPGPRSETGERGETRPVASGRPGPDTVSRHEAGPGGGASLSCHDHSDPVTSDMTHSTIAVSMMCRKRWAIVSIGKCDADNVEM